MNNEPFDTLYPPPVYLFGWFRLGDNYSDTGGYAAALYSTPATASRLNRRYASFENTYATPKLTNETLNMMKKTLSQNSNWTLSEKVTLVIAILSLVISTYSTYVSWQAKKPKLSIAHETGTCNNSTEKCYKLYIYNNDDSPCFEFSIEFDRKALGLPYLVRGYEDSSLFNSHINDNKITFPAMQYILLPDTGNKLWLGFLNKNEIANFVFIPNQENNLDRKLKITCVDTAETVNIN